MIVECCACNQQYPLDGNLYETSPVSQQPLLSCPHCGFQHLVSFLPVPQQRVNETPPVPPPPKLLTNLKLVTYYPILYGARILSATRVDQSGADDADVTDWSPDDDFILAFTLYTSKGPLYRYLKLLWRNVTDFGSFAYVASTGEINYTADTDLADQTDLDAGDVRCTAVPAYTRNSLRCENEGDNLMCNTFTYTFLDEHYSELQWGLSPSGAPYSKEYEFQVYDVTEDAVIATFACTLTMMADPAGGCPRQMMHYARRRRA